MRGTLKTGAVLLSAALVGTTASAAMAYVNEDAGAASPSDEPVTTDYGDPGTGRGERLLLLVTGSYATEAEAAAVAGSISYGDIQGLYVAPSDAFDVLDVYEQTNPSFVSSPCSKPRPEDVHVCETGQFERIRVQQEPRLRRVPGAQWRSELGSRRSASGRCAKDDAPPCVADRFDELLGEDGQLERGRWLVVSGFRTKLGAQQFLLASYTARQEQAVVLRVQKNDDTDIGLGQEPHPNGKGPLVSPLPDQEAHQ